MGARRDRVAAGIILVIGFSVFRLSPLHLAADSRYEMLFSQQLLRNGSFSVEGSALPELRTRTPGHLHRRGLGLSYQLVQAGERFYYFFPPGTVILSTPYVALANLFGISAIDRDGVYDFNGDTEIQAGLAAVLMAGLCVIVFFTSRLVLPLGWSVFVSVVAGFGSPVWSTASRVMWIHTWGIFILGGVIWLILRTDGRRSRLPPVFLASCLSWLYFIRPQFITSIVPVALYVLLYQRTIFLRLVLTGLAWLAVFFGYSYYHFGRLLPLYYTSELGSLRLTGTFLEGCAGTLVSPARGLLVYVPVLFSVGYLLVRYRSGVRLHLVFLALTVVSLHTALIGSYGAWHGGQCYGARYGTDLVPWLVLLAILAIEAKLRCRQTVNRGHPASRTVVETAIAGFLIVCSVVLNGVGALWMDATRWNALPTNIDHDHRRLWDWRHPPFLGVPSEPSTAPRNQPPVTRDARDAGSHPNSLGQIKVKLD
jgi:hypothetical protein